MKKSYEPFSKPLFYFTFGLAVIIWILTIVLLALLGVFGYILSSTQISTSCDSLTQTYYFNKYNSNSSAMVEISFISSILSVLFSTAIAVILLIMLIRLKKQTIVAFRNAIKVALYVLISLLVLSSIVPSGYYLSFWREFPQCLLTSYDSTQVQTILIIGLLVVVFSLLLWFLYLCCFYERVNSEEKYKQVTSNPTEPNERVRTYKQQEQVKKQPAVVYAKQKEPPKLIQPKQEVYKLQETNQNLYDSPSKRKINYVYSKQPQHSPVRHKNYQVHQPKPNPIVHQERSYKKEPANKEGDLVYLKPRNKDQDTYRVYQQQYLTRNQGRPILPTSGLQEREKASDYFRSVGEPPRRFSPSKKSEKQGVLLSYIRGKYAI